MGKGKKRLDLYAKKCGPSPLLRYKFLGPLQFLGLELESFAAAHKKYFHVFSNGKKERTSPIWETSSLLYFDSFCSNEIIQRLELQLLQLLRQEPQFQQQPS